MGLKLVEVEDDIAKELPTCSSGSQALMVIEGANLFRSVGIWSSGLREKARFILRSLDDSPLLVAQKEEPIIGIAEAKPGERVA